MSALQARRIFPLVGVLALLATLAPLPPAAHASVDGGAEAAFVSQLNDARRSAGLAPLPTSGDLTAVARRHSERMADQTHLHHNPNLGGDVSGWQKVGENVGRGPSVGSIHAALMDSPGHRANILDGDWTEVGVGVVARDGRLWVTQVFRLPSGASAAPAEPQEAAPAPASAPDEASTPDEPAPAAPAAAPAPEPEPEPRVTPPGPRHEVAAPPLPLDRTRLTLSRLEAREAGAVD